METIIQKTDAEHFRDEELNNACVILKRGGLVAFPTETVYGLGGDALNPEAAEKIYAAKGRPADNPLIIHIADMEDLQQLTEDIPQKAKRLAEAFWPGPLTMIFHKADIVPLSTTGGLETVAVRMPSHPVAQALIRRSGIYIAAPSANTSGRPSPTKAEHVVEDLSGKIDMIIDSGQVGIGIESTILDMTEEIPVILRPGYITKEMAEGIVGKVAVDPALSDSDKARSRPITAKAPGMKYRHYAPKGRLTIVEGKQDQVVAWINGALEEHRREKVRAAVIATEESKEQYRADDVYSIGSRQTEGSIAAGLYDILRKMDHIGAEAIYAESFAEDRMGQAIMNRLLKAAGYRHIQV